jgi:Fuc2NAc and GlcNAc transferase
MIYFFLFLLAIMITIAIKKFAIHDHPNERSAHAIPVPTGGGVAIVVTFYLGTTFLYIQGMVAENLFFALLGGLILAGVSFVDDMVELSPLLRLFAQFFSLLIAFYFLEIATQFPWYMTGLFFIALLWLINLYNFLDGIDGYAGSEGVFVSLGAYLFYHDSLFIVMAVSIMGFLFFNWQKASIFMGDVGSTFLGFFFGVMALYHYESGDDIMIWWILLGVFILDATITLLRRAFRGEKLSQAHKKHAFQRLVQSGFSHQKVVLYMIGFNLFALLFLYFFSVSVPLFIGYNVLLYILIKNIDKRRSF